MQTQNSTTSKDIWRKDYQPPDFTVESMQLRVVLDPVATRIFSRLTVKRLGEAEAPLVLNGEGLTTHRIAIDGQDKSLEEAVSQDLLTLKNVPDEFVLETEVEINPKQNTSLNGLYLSRGIFCTQCEPQGFRRITWMIDRPDVMAIYESVRIEAPRNIAPVLLSNGDCIEQGDMEDGWHYAVWKDPFPKPTYLFALVAGVLEAVRDSFTTCSGKEVALAIYVRDGDQPLCGHAMESLKQSMRWDEDVYGLEYDLGQFNIVSVDDFNFGAMENKSLNIFNSKYVLADAQTATDTDFSGIQAVIAHEYFHNWTGNRVTCRDWFQLSLKEGLTVFRDHEFSADMGDPATERIAQVRRLRTAQFPEDAGPLSHSVRPESYREINNFYTATVYEKGSELVRMYRSLIGPRLFHKGVDLYFERHDGTAATCEDFLSAMCAASGVDLSGFERWYSQAGTPRLKASGQWDAEAKTYRLKLEQRPAHEDQAPFLMPIEMGLIGQNSGALPLKISGDVTVSTDAVPNRAVIHLKSSSQDILFTDVAEKPVVSLLGGFSAPVYLEQDCSDADLAFLGQSDTDGFGRWQAIQSLYERILLRSLEADKPFIKRELPQNIKGLDVLLDALGNIIHDSSIGASLRASLLSLPTEAEMASKVEVIDAQRIRLARQALSCEIQRIYQRELADLFASCDQDGPYDFNAEDCGRRFLLGTTLTLLSAGGASSGLALAQHLVDKRRNMTEVLYGLACLSDWPNQGGREALQSFYENWSEHHLVVNKWLRLQAMADHDAVVDDIKAQLDHAAFSLSNPNNVYSLIGGFMMGNVPWFYTQAGLDLAFDVISRLDRINPQVAARLAGVFAVWRKVEPTTRARLEKTLQRLAAMSALSRDLREIVDKSLGV